MNYIPSTSIVWALAEVTVDQCPAHRCGQLLGSLSTTRLSATAVSFVTPGIFTWERDRDRGMLSSASSLHSATPAGEQREVTVPALCPLWRGHPQVELKTT